MYNFHLHNISRNGQKSNENPVFSRVYRLFVREKKERTENKIKKLTINVKKVLTNDKYTVIVDLSINVKYLVF